MTLENSASIAHAVVTLAQSGTPLVAGVLTHGLHDDAARIAADVGRSIGMETLVIDMAGIEYHPGALNLVAYDRVEPATATGRPVLFVLKEADLADNCVVAAMCTIIQRRLGNAPCAILALTSDIGEDRVSAQVAEGLDGHVGQVIRSRTSAENARMIEDAIARMAD